jgi:Phosphotransferase enzyme family
VGARVELVEALGRIAVEAGGGEPEVLARRDDAIVVRGGTAVAKAHAPDTDGEALHTRLRIALAPPLRSILLAPLSGDRPRTLAGRQVTLWPHLATVDRDDPDAAPWEETAALLAALHRVRLDDLPLDAAHPDAAPLDTARHDGAPRDGVPRGRSLPGAPACSLPAMRGPLKVARALNRLNGAGAHPAARAAVLRAAAGLPAWARGEAPPPPSRVLVHGDLHLGQLVRRADGRWLLIDVDDLGVGDPGWDLARPAAWFAVGLLAPDVWGRFLAAYRSGGGPAVPPGDDGLWGVLDVPARALTVQSAALAVVRAGRAESALDEVDNALVDGCARMAALTPADAVS